MTMSLNTSSPRLFFSADDLPRLRQRFLNDPRFAGVREALAGFDRAAERKFLREEVDVTEPLGHFRRVHDCAQEMAFLFLMTGDEDVAELALEAARTMMKFKLWDFFIEEYSRAPMGNQRASSGLIALACTLDWLGDYVLPAEQAEWLAAIQERGCELCAASLRRYANPLRAEPWVVNPATATARIQKRWAFPSDGQRRVEITAETNLRAAPAGALAIGIALLTRRGIKHADLPEWTDLVTQSLGVFNRIYLPDGSYGEGVNYANYTSESLFMAIEALRRAGVADLREGINWRGHAQFMLNMAMPTAANRYDVINTGDAGVHRDKTRFLHPAGRPESRSALPFWIAREYRDGSAQWFGENLAADHNLWSVIFFDETVAPEPPENQRLSWHNDLHWMVARTGFRAEDLVVNLRSGIGWNHEHADRNNLIIKAHGEPLVIDPLRPPYHFAEPAWIMRTTLGHSAVLVDGHGHFYHNGVEGTNSTIAQARVVRDVATPEYCCWVSDATQAYRLVDVNIRSVVRAVVVLYELQVVLVVDRVSKWKEALAVEARFFVDNGDGAAELTVGHDGFAIKRPGAWAKAKVFGRHDFSIAADKLAIADKLADQFPYVAVNTAAAQATTLVTAFAMAKSGAQPVDVVFTATQDAITASIGAVSCRIADAECVPAIAIDLGANA